MANLQSISGIDLFKVSLEEAYEIESVSVVKTELELGSCSLKLVDNPNGRFALIQSSSGDAAAIPVALLTVFT